jgi:sugar lactone lactonase YvrE
MLSTRTLGIAVTTLGWLGLAGCSATGTDGQVGQMGIVGPPGPVGPMGSPGSSGNAIYDELDLPGTAFFPESITSAADGTMFISSIASTTIVKFAPGSNTPVTFVSNLATGKSMTGVLVDEADKSLLACVNDLSPPGGFVPLLKRYSLADGTEKNSYTFPGAGACNDMAFDGQHNLYVTDSFGKILKLANAGTVLTTWSSDTALAGPPNGFGADGIAWDGQSSLYVNNIGYSTLVRIPIAAGTGNAGTPVAIAVSPALVSPDGMRALDANTLIVAEGTRLTRLTINGNNAIGISLSNRLDGPSGVTKIGSNYYVSEGQVGKYIGMMTPNIPFLIRRVPNF